ncbi:MAG: PilZ domain-containing protein [Planctomycetota bacterium]
MVIGGTGFPDLLTGSVIRGIRKVKKEMRVGVEFLDVEHLHRQLRGAQWALFNRRGNYRFQQNLGEASIVTAEVKSGTGGPLQIMGVRDLSASGLAVYVSGSEADSRKPGAPLTAKLQLPEEGQPLDVHLTVVHHFTTRSTTRCGCAIDRESTAGAEEICDTLRAYVIDRQAEQRTKEDV